MVKNSLKYLERAIPNMEIYAACAEVPLLLPRKDWEFVKAASGVALNSDAPVTMAT